MDSPLDYKIRNDKKKILFLISSLRIGGAERVCCNICDNLNFNKYEIYIISLSAQIPLGNTLKNVSKLKIFSCKEPTLLKFPWVSFKSFKLFHKYVKEIKPDIVHSHFWGMSCFYLYSFLILKQKPVFIATIHNSEFIYTSNKIIEKIFRFVEKSIYRLLRFNLVSISTAVDNMVKKTLFYKTLSKIENGIDTNSRVDPIYLNQLKILLKLETAYPIIINVGRASEVKRQEDIIKALPDIIKEFPKTKLLLVGRDNSVRFSSIVKQMNIDNNVLLLDERDDVRNLLNISDIGVFPSLYEGLPLALTEMMAAGLPIIATDIQVLKEITGDGLAALYVPVKNPNAISNAVIEIINNPDLLNRIRTNAQQIVAERYSLNTMIKKYEALYENLLPNKDKSNQWHTDKFKSNFKFQK